MIDRKEPWPTLSIQSEIEQLSVMWCRDPAGASVTHGRVLKDSIACPDIQRKHVVLFDLQEKTLNNEY